MRNPCVAHRGWSGAAPENTLAAIRMAVEAPDVTWIEIDVRMSRDGVPVLLHDSRLNRTTNGRGKVDKKTAEQLALLDAGSWFSEKFAGEPLPTLQQALELADGKVNLNIELKTNGKRYPGLERRTVELIRSFGIEQQCVITSFSKEALRKVREASSDIRCGLIIDNWREHLPITLKSLDCNFLSIGYKGINKQRLKRLQDANIQTMVWTLNNVRLIRKYALLDSSLLICTNYPDRWRDALNTLPKL